MSLRQEVEMNNLNSIIIEGNLVRDPDMGCTTKGTAFCNFAVASNRYYKLDGERQSEVSFFDIETYSRTAEVCEKHLTKGRGVRVVGRLKQHRWEDVEGKVHTRVRIVAEHVEFKPIFQKTMEEKDAPKGSSEVVADESAGSEIAEVEEAVI